MIARSILDHDTVMDMRTHVEAALKFAIFSEKVREKTSTAVTTVRKCSAKSFVSVKAYFRKLIESSLRGIAILLTDGGRQYILMKWCVKLVPITEVGPTGPMILHALNVWESFGFALDKLRSLPALIKATLRKQRDLFRLRRTNNV